MLNSGNFGLSAPALPDLEPRVNLPLDKAMPAFPSLFESAWVWHKLSQEFQMPEARPEGIRVDRLSYRPGRRATATYDIRWPDDFWQIDDKITIEMVMGKPLKLFRFPDDPYLPGLPAAVSAVDARELLTKYVDIRPRRVRLEMIRYRPASRAVIRCTTSGKMNDIGRSILYCRVMRPRRVSRLMTAATLVGSSGFVLPRLVGCWTEGGVVWNVRIPGVNVRDLVFEGNPPEPHRILDHLERLWSTPVPEGVRRRNILSGFETVQRTLSHLLQEQESKELLERIVETLEPWVKQWRPTVLAHNDFYDDQMLFIPSTASLALVDFEETALGDPMLDVGNMLAHLSRSVQMGAPQAVEIYWSRFRNTALERYGWETRDLDLREAYCLFRLATNPFQSLTENWREEIVAGLSVVDHVLKRAA